MINEANVLDTKLFHSSKSTYLETWIFLNWFR